MRPTRTPVTVLLAGIVLSCPLGCGTKSAQEPLSGLSRSESDKLSAGHSRFETSEDPAFTADTHFAAGQLAESQGNLQQALDQYRKAVQIDRKHLPSLYRLGVLQTQLKAFPQAIATWKDYIQATRPHGNGYGNLGFCHELAGNPTEAERAYKDGIQRDPANELCRTNYGLMLARAGRVSEAMNQWRTILTEAQAIYNLGSVYEQQGRTEEARIQYRRALQLDPQLIEAQTRLAALDQV